MEILEIEEEYIELCKVLKIQNLVASGGEAKYVISEGLVRVDGEVETRKRRKLRGGALIEFNGQALQIKRKNKE
jgi:ribosome-associated protein